MILGGSSDTIVMLEQGEGSTSGDELLKDLRLDHSFFFNVGETESNFSGSEIVLEDSIELFVKWTGGEVTWKAFNIESSIRRTYHSNSDHLCPHTWRSHQIVSGASSQTPQSPRRVSQSNRRGFRIGREHSSRAGRSCIRRAACSSRIGSSTRIPRRSWKTRLRFRKLWKPKTHRKSSPRGWKITLFLNNWLFFLYWSYIILARSATLLLLIFCGGIPQSHDFPPSGILRKSNWQHTAGSGPQVCGMS